jgi:lipopolysaccharide/colanic/teichoic acid biosynthesis glycosyltransferase
MTHISLEAREAKAAAPVVSTLRAHKFHRRALYGVMPSVVGGAITLVRSDSEANALIMLVAMLAATSVLSLYKHPLHLIPLARYVVSFLVPAAGVALAVGAAEFGGTPIGHSTALTAFLGASLISLVGMRLEDRFVSDRPISMAVIGPGLLTERLQAELEENRIRSHQVLGYIADEEDPSSQAQWLGTLADVRSVVVSNGIDLIVMGAQSQRLRMFEIAAKACLDLPVRMIEATALYEDVLGHVPIGAINSAWFQFIMHPRYSPSSPASKRGLDLLVATSIWLISSPVFVLCAIAVKLEDRGPVFYRQRRAGEEGREFNMIKFRTLRPDADQMFAAGLDEEDLVTRVGAVLRKFHLNELPQLLQVMRGEMSLVGPRPEPPEVVESLSGIVPHYESRGLVKPGLTGWAQVRCGYAGTHFGSAWKTCHDLYYIKHRSARFDLLILLQTVQALLEREDEEQLPAQDFILGDAAGLVHR